MRAAFFFFNDTATTEIYTLSLHDALPISRSVTPHSGTKHLERSLAVVADQPGVEIGLERLDAIEQLLVHRRAEEPLQQDRKSTRLNSSHANISYAVFCLKKKKIHKDYELP